MHQREMPFCRCYSVPSKFKSGHSCSKQYQALWARRCHSLRYVWTGGKSPEQTFIGDLSVARAASCKRRKPDIRSANGLRQMSGTFLPFAKCLISLNIHAALLRQNPPFLGSTNGSTFREDSHYHRCVGSSGDRSSNCVKAGDGRC